MTRSWLVRGALLGLGSALLLGCTAQGVSRPRPDGRPDAASDTNPASDLDLTAGEAFTPEASGHCSSGQVRSCYSGPVGTQGTGQCKAGQETCTGGIWGSCAGEVLPADELCDGKDNNCDGKVDEGLSRSCYSGPAGTENVGPCKAGTQSCAGGSWGSCQGEVLPAEETCDGKDNNCDGKVDEGLSRSCYSGPAGTENVGLCKAGTQSCNAGTWGTCQGQVLPATELCDGKDNNCDGKTDESLTQSCYTGPAGTEGVGICKAGTRTCNAGTWGACTGQVLPAASETCGNSLDDNCNGQTDEGCATCSHGMCATGGALLASCGPTIAAVCNKDPWCCSTSWDSTCVREVRTIGLSLACPEAQGSCTHSLCTIAATSPLVSGCDATKANCVATICALDSFCCQYGWDDVCVSEVASLCGKNCNTK